MVRAIVHQPDRKQVATTMLDSRISALYSEVSDLVDIDKSSQELIKRVDEDGKSTDLRVVSIYGFGGLGKTTLAKVVHDHLKGQTDIIPTGEEGKPIVKKRYDCMAFVSVSKNPDMKKVFKNILYELDRINHENIHSSQKDVNQFIDQIKSFLGDKRYTLYVMCLHGCFTFYQTYVPKTLLQRTILPLWWPGHWRSPVQRLPEPAQWKLQGIRQRAMLNCRRLIQ